MNRSGTVTRSVWIALALGALAAGAAWFALLRRPPLAPATTELATLSAERDQLKDSDDRARDIWRQQRDAMRRHAWSAESRAALRGRLDGGWHWDSQGESRARLHRVNPSLAEWTAYAALVAQLAATPGLVVEAVELHADGTATNRQFTQVQLGLRFIVSDTPAEDAATRKPSPAPAAGPSSPSFRPDPPGPSAGISNNQNPQE